MSSDYFRLTLMGHRNWFVSTAWILWFVYVDVGQQGCPRFLGCNCTFRQQRSLQTQTPETAQKACAQLELQVAL